MAGATEGTGAWYATDSGALGIILALGISSDLEETSTGTIGAGVGEGEGLGR